MNELLLQKQQHITSDALTEAVWITAGAAFRAAAVDNSSLKDFKILSQNTNIYKTTPALENAAMLKITQYLKKKKDYILCIEFHSTENPNLCKFKWESTASSLNGLQWNMMTPHNQMKSICHETQVMCDANERSQCPREVKTASKDLMAKLFSFPVNLCLIHAQPPLQKAVLRKCASQPVWLWHAI